MTATPELESELQHARELQARGSRSHAERKYKELLARGEPREPVLCGLVDLYLEARRPADAARCLVALTEAVPDHLVYYARLADLLDGLGRTDTAIAHYERLLRRQPGIADAHYNVALLYKKAKRWREAAAAYEAALAAGVERAHEVYSNLGVLWSELDRPERAVEMYERALALDPGYVPALFNLGGLHEEGGDRRRSTQLYRRILALEPGHSGALSRLVHARRITRGDDPLLRELDTAIDAGGGDALAREELLFARGKALDDLGRYPEAFEACRMANALGARRNLPYDRRAVEQAFDRLIERFDAKWLRDSALETAASPIFVCGMLRSGSTLLEQILSGHAEVTAGGELDLFPWLVARRLGNYPDGALAATREQLRQLREAYVAHVREIFGSADHVTDKRPDNFLYLGLIAAVFPGARVVYTKRDAADNCLSIWFQHLARLSYATDLAHTAHYYAQHERLMAHWRELLGDALFTVDYDELVRHPEPLLRRLLQFLGLPWDPRCLEFRDSARPVKTASVWQVREALHTRSSGRWRHYAPLLRDVEGPWR